MDRTLVWFECNGYKAFKIDAFGLLLFSRGQKKGILDFHPETSSPTKEDFLKEMKASGWMVATQDTLVDSNLD